VTSGGTRTPSMWHPNWSNELSVGRPKRYDLRLGTILTAIASTGSTYMQEPMLLGSRSD
jgi:hypothetical protein